MTKRAAIFVSLWLAVVCLAAPRQAGEHRRLETARGPVHIWTPEGYDPRTAGIVIYVHGFFTSSDEAWEDHHLAGQFAASARNALFIMPEAPASIPEPVVWPNLNDLLRTVRDVGKMPVPAGPLVVVGHSGAFHTIVPWLKSGSIRSVVLIDALYRYENEFARWLARGTRKSPRQMIVIGQETRAVAEAFIRRFPNTPRRAQIPDDIDQLSMRERAARLLYFGSQYDHMDLVAGGKVIPFVLQLTPLPGVIREHEFRVSQTYRPGPILGLRKPPLRPRSEWQQSEIYLHEDLLRSCRIF